MDVKTTDDGLRLLSLDGGGVRGLVSLYLLKKLLSYVGNPKPCEYFDMIAGTSTGGLIAIMLGRLEMTVDECIESFTELMDSVFDPKFKKKYPFSVGKGSIVQARYDTSNLEAAIKKTIMKAKLPVDALMRGSKKSACKTFVVALASGARTSVCFTDYPRPNEMLSTFYNEVKIWEAARATSAATSFFSPIDITAANVTRRFLDGGLGFNNPINELWVEAQQQFCGDGAPLQSKIRVMLSVGTGRPPLAAMGEKLKDITLSIIAIATETQTTATLFHKMHPELANNDRYFRFNPPDISEVGIDEASKRDIISERCEAFGEDPDVDAMMVRWQAAGGQEQKRPEPSKPRPEERIYTFDRLDRREIYISPQAKTYWRYLTLQGWNTYEKIFNECRSYEGKVWLQDFLQQFNPKTDPQRDRIIATWIRLLRDPRANDPWQTPHRKPFILAILYMLHMETRLSLPAAARIDADRREFLKRYAKWVPCACDAGCVREWNFANEVGMSRVGGGGGGGNAGALGLGRVVVECKIAKLFGQSGWESFWGGKKYLDRFEEMRARWGAARKGEERTRD